MTVEKAVMIEMQGEGEPAIIHYGKQKREQYLTPEQIAEIGLATRAWYWAEMIEGVWHLNRRFTAAPGARETLRDQIRRGRDSSAPRVRIACTPSTEDRHGRR